MWQAVIVALLLIWSLLFMLQRLLPASWRQQLAGRMQQRGWSRLSRWLMPAAGGCGEGCAQCSPTCASASPSHPAPVQWRTPTTPGH